MKLLKQVAGVTRQEYERLKYAFTPVEETGSPRRTFPPLASIRAQRLNEPPTPETAKPADCSTGFFVELWGIEPQTSRVRF